ncbi:DUF2273 domain-containing protein [Lutispora thermophila]|uniref:Small integral membrane protein n=1 Tax=Lutispora thermophila DSM 19022 TaxID=1122184 RepID=A0A1M6F5D0_9FIRM|nr:DUF2273 domain-containing protein [Lutispora thermophila]SHI92881.1 Small integral membrane protein [Lutispora thermophila DSM 19022]
MDKDKLINFIINRQGKIIGAIIGFITGLFLLTLGFFKTLILLACSMAGYYIGKKLIIKKTLLSI